MDAIQGNQSANCCADFNSPSANCSRTEHHCDGTSMTFEDGQTTFNGTGGDDNMQVHTNWDGSTDITCNGNTYHLTPEQSKNLVINGGGGDDNITSTGYQLCGEKNNLTLNGGSGDDTINGGSMGANINGGSGDDTLNGGWGRDNIDGGSGDDTINGGWGNDNIDGGSGDDTIDGGWGDDFINGGSGDDTIDGGQGRDIVCDDGRVSIDPDCSIMPLPGGDTIINVNIDNSTNITNEAQQSESSGGLPSFLDPLGLLGGGGPNLPGGGGGFPLNLIPFK
jgi:Ca2+-binding RTX toxin-like protein